MMESKQLWHRVATVLQKFAEPPSGDIVEQHLFQAGLELLLLDRPALDFYLFSLDLPDLPEVDLSLSTEQQEAIVQSGPGEFATHLDEQSLRQLLQRPGDLDALHHEIHEQLPWPWLEALSRRGAWLASQTAQPTQVVPAGRGDTHAESLNPWSGTVALRLRSAGAKESVRRAATQRFQERYLLLRSTGVGDQVEVRYSAALDGASATDVVALVDMPADLRQRVQRHIELLDNRPTEVRPRTVLQLGMDLAEVALPEVITQQVLGDLNSAAGQRLRIWVDDRGLEGIPGWPWEYLYVSEGPRGGFFLALHPACSLVRSCYSAGPGPSVSPIRPTGSELRALVVWADPQEGCSPLYAESQIRAVLDLLNRPGLSCRLLGPRWALGQSAWFGLRDPAEIATRANLQRELTEHPPHLVYLVCHGDFDSDTQQGVLLLEGAAQGADRLQAGTLAGLFQPLAGPGIVFLEACRSAGRGPSGKGLSVADALAAQGRIVLGKQFVWPSPSSPPFWLTLFQFLTTGEMQPVDDAVFAAREYLSRLQSPSDWGVPVLFRPRPVSVELAKPTSPPTPSLFVRVLREMERQTGLNLLGPAGLSPDLIRDLETQLGQAERNSPRMRSAPATDPFQRLFCGESEQGMMVSSPVWVTHLLSCPAELSWRGGGTGPWRVTLRDQQGRWNVETATPAIALPAERILPGSEVTWQVRPADAPATAPPLVRGLFRVLPEAEALAVRLQWSELASLSFGPAAILGIVDLCRRYHLHEDLIRYLTTLPTSEDPVIAFAVSRGLAGTYSAVADVLHENYSGVPETEWAADLARQHASASWGVSLEAPK